MTLDFWFDYSCPYAYVASTQAEALAARTGATLRWRPMLLGGVFAARQTPQNLATTLSPVKAGSLWRDQHRMADRAGIPLDFPPEHPRRTVAALRATLARGNDPAIIHAFYRAYWAERRAIEDEAVVRSIAGDVDLDAQREPLRALTDQAIRLGVFGAPTWVLWNGEPDDEAAGFRLWWGGDRADLVEEAITGRFPAKDPSPGRGELEVWFDYSSPYAYLGVMAARELADRLQISLRYRVMLLGAVFKAQGIPNVPIFTFNAAKQLWYARDIEEHARRLGLPYRFSPHFPLLTTLPARLTLAHPDPERFVRAVFTATWGEGEDPRDLAVLRRCGAAEVLPAGVADTDENLLAAAEAQKGALFAATQEAVDHGMFGAPSWVVRRDGHTWTFWGQDRMEQVEAALRGWSPPA